MVKYRFEVVVEAYGNNIYQAWDNVVDNAEFKDLIYSTWEEVCEE